MVDYSTTSPQNRSSGWKRAHTQRSKRQKKKAVRYRTGRKREVNVQQVLRLGLDWGAKGLLAVVLMYGLFHAYQFFTTAPQFRISRITFHGNKTVNAEHLYTAAQPVFGENIFHADIEGVLQPIRLNHWVHDVSAIRKLPQSLHIHVQERTPYARLELEQTYLVDPYGILIAPDSGGYGDLPLIQAGTLGEVELGKPVHIDWVVPGLKAMNALNQLDAFREQPFHAVRYTSPHHLVFTSKSGQVTLRMAVDRLAEGFDNFKVVLEALQSDITKVRFIDLSFADRVVVRDEPWEGGTDTPIKKS